MMDFTGCVPRNDVLPDFSLEGMTQLPTHDSAVLRRASADEAGNVVSDESRVIAASVGPRASQERPGRLQRRPRGPLEGQNVKFHIENVGFQRFRGKSSLAAKSGARAPKRVPRGPTGGPKGARSGQKPKLEKIRVLAPGGPNEAQMKPKSDQERPPRGRPGAAQGKAVGAPTAARKPKMAPERSPGEVQEPLEQR